MLPQSTVDHEITRDVVCNWSNYLAMLEWDCYTNTKTHPVLFTFYGSCCLK